MSGGIRSGAPRPSALVRGGGLSPAGETPRPNRLRKVRTADCRNCLLLKSLTAAGLAQETIEAICDRMWLGRLRRGQVLFTEGNRATHLFAIRSGRVKLGKVDMGGHERIVAILESGDLFGLEAVFDTAYATGAEALTEGEVCSASGRELQALLADVPRVSLDLARYLHYRLQQAMARQACLGAPNARGKIAALLLHGLSADAEAEPVVRNELTHAELGGVLGLASETVCRTLNAFKSERLIEIQRGTIRIKDEPALRAAAGL